MADKHTYPLEQQMKAEVYYEFELYAIFVLDNERQTPGSESASRISFARDVLNANVNANGLSRAVATNASIADKIEADDMSYVNDIAYVVQTQYGSSIATPLFTIMAEAKYPPA